FGAERVIDTPLGESGIVGCAIGLAYHGFRPVCEIQFDGFVFPAFNQITSQLARFRRRTDGAVAMPVVVRIPYGGGIGAVEHHGESPEAYFTGTAGLRVVTPSDPQDAYFLTQQAIRCEDPVVVFEPKRRYWEKAEVDVDATPAPMDRCVVRRAGTDATLITYGPMVRVCEEAAAAAEEEGTSLEVLDLRSLAPLDVSGILASVRRTRRAVVVHEAPTTLGPGAEVAARLSEALYYEMEAPVLRVGGFDTPFPPARAEQQYLPDVDRILDAVDRSVAA
ncbi:MAG TPA: transketolase C-terminal domain-containing protein, partial [Mycobacteriales bacterium]|nr:transketolase C-terminal domain-containing protein [Mycobacteriales bacterium]